MLSRASVNLTLGRIPMYNRRYNNRILAGTALALVLAVPLAVMAKNGNPPAAVPMAATGAEQTAPQAAPAAIATEANEPSAISTGAFPAPAPAAEQTNTEEAATGQTTASEQVTAPDPLAALDPADRAVAEKLRDLLAMPSDKLFAGKNERAAVEAFYQARNFAPLWLEKGVETARAQSAIARLKNADTDGLEPSDYKTPSFAGLDPEALAAAELKLTRAVLTYARHVQAGRFAYTRVSRNIELPQVAPEPADVLRSVADAGDAGKALEIYSPQNEPYRKLKAALAELRAKPGATKNEAKQIEIIAANMERWRWYPRDLGDAHVIVNQPDFTLKVMHNGNQAWTTRVVIGKPSMATPLLSETMKTITVNPTWTVPQSIVRNEYLPALAQDPTVLSRMGLHVSYNSGGGVTITQPPGAGNALGRVRFNFRNRFSVYQHDTPDKYYFAHEVRAYSHGCMRVQDPAKYAEVLLNIARPQEHWTSAKVQSMYGRGEQDLQLQPTPIWVHLTYQTAFVDNAGKLQFRRDIYNLDSRTVAAIKSDRGNLEPVPERKREEIAGSSPRKPAIPARTGALPQPIYR
jgi:murein L,D-transpeptidase YcbB/YkuD